MLKLDQTARVAVSATKDSLKLGAKITAGNIINRRAAALVKPALPVMVRGYAETEMGEAAIAVAVASALVHFMPTNTNAKKVAEAMYSAAGIKFVGSFNLEDKFEELIAGIDLSALTSADETVETETAK